VSTTAAAQAHMGKLLLIAAFFAFANLAGDVAYMGRFSGEALVARSVWGLGLALLAAASRVPVLDRPNGIGLAAGLLSVACWTALTVITGGAESAYFDAMATLPLVFGVLGPGMVAVVAAVAVATILANVGLLAWEGAPLDLYPPWITFGGSTGALAVIGARTFDRLRAAESRAEAARRRALDELAESESRRLQAEKLALVGRLASGLAHEINNPLTAVKSNLEVLRGGGSAGELIDESLLGVERIEAIVESLRAFARSDEAGILPCSLHELIAEARVLAAAPLREVAEVEWSVPDNLPRIRANPSQLVQVLVHLLVNAAEAIAEARPGGRGRIRVEGRAYGAWVLVDVVDDGVGLSPTARAHLFEPFFTTKPPGKGTGLGLALSRQYLRRFDGNIEAIDEPRGGTRFRLRLAAVPASAAA